MCKFEMKFDKREYVHPRYNQDVFVRISPQVRGNCLVKNVKLCTLIWTVLFIISSDNIYDIMKRDINRFDISDYVIDNAYSIPLASKKVPSLMKDENNSAIITEFVGLRTKMYAMQKERRIRKRQKALRAMLWQDP